MTLLSALLEVTIYSWVLFLIIVVLKRALKDKSSARFQYLIWFLLIARLCIPITFVTDIRLFVIPETNVLSSQDTYITESAYKPTYTQDNILQDRPLKNKQGISQTDASQIGIDLPSKEPVNMKYISTAKPTIKFTWQQVVIAIWLIGAISILSFFAIMTYQMNKKIKSSEALSPKRLISMVAGCREELGIEAPITPYLVDDITTPALTVSLRPKLLLPTYIIKSMDDEQILFALRHELTHYRRKDHIISLILRILEAIYWFNPIVWIASKRIQLDMETACDSDVVKDMGSAEKGSYAMTILEMFSQDKRPKFVLGMALSGTRQVAEERIRGIYKNAKMRSRTKLIVVMLVVAMLFSCFTTACKPTPEKKVVVGKGSGDLEDIISGEPAPLETTRNFLVPSKLQYDLSGANEFTVQVDADVSIPDVDAYPIMSAQRDTITQEQADKIIATLLKGEPLYKPVWEKNKAQIQTLIDYYEYELSVAKIQELKETYKGYLLELMEEYDAAPEVQPMELASLELAFMEDFPDLANHYAEEVEVIEDGETRIKMVWTDEARDRAKADGHKSIYGITAYEHGVRQMRMGIHVSGDNSMNCAFFDIFGGGRLDAPPPTIEKLTLEQAIVQGKEILEKMGMGDFSLVNAYTVDTIRHDLYFKRDIKGIPQSAIAPAHVWNEDYAPAFEGESVSMSIDDAGLLDFQWNSPSKFKATENTNAPLIPFNEVQEIFDRQIVLHNQWTPPDKDIVSYRLVIDQVRLSYMPIRQANNRDSFLYVPVWDFCGQQIARYRDDYPKGQGDHYVLDENNERVIIDDSLNEVSFLTINAIDGSVIDRNKGY